jgi:hypothetical protein
MKTQKHMIESFHLTHGNFMQNLNVSLDMLDHDISEAKEIDTICTGSWCKAIENSLDELSNYLYSISEPRWVSNTDSKQLSRMRIRLHDMYTKYRSLGEVTIH